MTAVSRTKSRACRNSDSCEWFLKAEALRGRLDALRPKLSGESLGAFSLGVPLTASQVTLLSGQVTLPSESFSLLAESVPLLGDLLKAQEGSSVRAVKLELGSAKFERTPSRGLIQPFISGIAFNLSSTRLRPKSSE